MARLGEKRRWQEEIRRLEVECAELRNRLDDPAVELRWVGILKAHADELERLIEEEES